MAPKEPGKKKSLNSKAPSKQAKAAAPKPIVPKQSQPIPQVAVPPSQVKAIPAQTSASLGQSFSNGFKLATNGSLLRVFSGFYFAAGALSLTLAIFVLWLFSSSLVPLFKLPLAVAVGTALSYLSGSLIAGLFLFACIWLVSVWFTAFAIGSAQALRHEPRDEQVAFKFGQLIAQSRFWPLAACLIVAGLASLAAKLALNSIFSLVFGPVGAFGFFLIGSMIVSASLMLSPFLSAFSRASAFDCVKASVTLYLRNPLRLTAAWLVLSVVRVVALALSVLPLLVSFAALAYGWLVGSLPSMLWGFFFLLLSLAFASLVLGFSKLLYAGTVESEHGAIFQAGRSKPALPSEPLLK